MNASTSSSVKRTWLPIRTHGSRPALTSRSIRVRRQPQVASQRLPVKQVPRPASPGFGRHREHRVLRGGAGLLVVYGQHLNAPSRTLVQENRSGV